LLSSEARGDALEATIDRTIRTEAASAFHPPRDSVNIARLEGLAAPGGICVSGTVRDHIGDRLPYAFEDMGEQRVKNIAQPVRVYALRPAKLSAGGNRIRNLGPSQG